MRRSRFAIGGSESELECARSRRWFLLGRKYGPISVSLGFGPPQVQLNIIRSFSRRRPEAVFQPLHFTLQAVQLSGQIPYGHIPSVPLADGFIGWSDFFHFAGFTLARRGQPASPVQHRRSQIQRQLRSIVGLAQMSQGHADQITVHHFLQQLGRIFVG